MENSYFDTDFTSTSQDITTSSDAKDNMSVRKSSERKPPPGGATDSKDQATLSNKNTLMTVECNSSASIINACSTNESNCPSVVSTPARQAKTPAGSIEFNIFSVQWFSKCSFWFIKCRLWCIWWPFWNKDLSRCHVYNKFINFMPFLWINWQK